MPRRIQLSCFVPIIFSLPRKFFPTLLLPFSLKFFGNPYSSHTLSCLDHFSHVLHECTISFLIFFKTSSHFIFFISYSDTTITFTTSFQILPLPYALAMIMVFSLSFLFMPVIFKIWAVRDLLYLQLLPPSFWSFFWHIFFPSFLFAISFFRTLAWLFSFKNA